MNLRLLVQLTILSLGCSAQEKYLDIIKVSDSVYVFKPKIDWVHSNSTAIIGTDGIFIIDTFMQTNYADELIKRLKKISPLPVNYIFNTHGHTDHVMGNSVFKTAYPDCKIIMNDSTYSKYPRNYSYGGIKTFADAIPELEKELAEGKTAEGLVLSEPLKAFSRWQIDEYKAYVKFFTPTTPANADIVFSDRMTIHFGNQDIILMPAKGWGHDTGDAMAWLPKKKILVTGDVVVGPTPYAIRGRVNEMLQSLQQVIDMNPLVVVPGHGEVMQGVGYVKDEMELFSVMQQRALDAIKEGLSYKEAVSQITIPKELEEKFTQGDDVRKWAMKSFFTNWVIHGTYRQNGALKK